jgi:hypothetical protein
MTIEETLKINFDEILSCFDDEGEIKDGFPENAQCCIDAINEAVNKFFSGAETIAHQGFNVYGCDFHTNVNVSVGENIVSLTISCGNCTGNLAEYIFEPTTDLVLTKSYKLVSIK